MNGTLKPLDTPEEWAKRYDIETDAVECPRCKIEFALEIPIAFKDYRGLAMKDHGCGPDMPFRVVPIGEKIEFWEQFRPEDFEG